ncbi:hypothetical protein ACHQIX_08875 [Klebsiella pneumoniae]|uniref:hypothetical protein n=1 Tax=Klebsiella pneumoniae TaxID=573 RepID=UPI003981A8C1
MMERREFAKRLAIMVGVGAAGAVSARETTAEKRSQVQQLYSAQQLHDTVNILRFGTQEKASDAFYNAFIYLNKRGGGNLLVPNGNYVFDKPVKTRIGCKISIYTSSNSIMTMKTDGDMFDITGSENAAIRFFGNGEFIYDGPATKDAACIRFVSLTNGKKYATSSFECNGRIRIRKGDNEWAYGIHLTDVRDAVLVNIQFDGLNLKGKPSSQIGVFAQAKSAASVSWVISDLQFNDLKTGFHIESDSVPGIEGLKFFNCDMAGVENGIVFNNNSDYHPPQIELIGCHINGHNTLISIKKAISIHIVGGLYYRNGMGGAFFEFDGVQDVSIVGPSFSVTGKKTDIPGIVIDGNNEESGLFRISDCHFWSHGRKSPFIELKGNISGVTLSNSTKDSSGKWIETSGMKSPKSLVNVCSDTIKLSQADKGDTWGISLKNNNGVIDLSSVPPGIVFIDNGEIKKINGGRIGSEYTLVSESIITLVKGVNVKNGSVIQRQAKVVCLINMGGFYIAK